MELTVDQDAAQTLEFVVPGHFGFGPSVLGFQPLNRSDCCVFLLDIQQFYVVPTQLYLCFVWISEQIAILFPYAALTDWFL